MASILILCGSAEGQTTKIAKHVAAQLERAGHEAQVVPASQVKQLVEVDAVIIGASIHIGQYAKELLNYIKAHRAELTHVQRPYLRLVSPGCCGSGV